MAYFGRSTVVFSGIALALASGLQARTCSGNGDLVGGYGWTANRVLPSVPAGDSAPGAILGSPTAIGALTAGAANSAAFASVGRLYLDGNGGMFSSSASGVPVAQVGTYAVNTDCTIAAIFADTFATPGGAGLTPIQASVTFEGVVVQNGAEIDLAQTGAATGTSVTLKKTRQFIGCGNDGLTGTFGLASSGVSTPLTVGVTPVSTPFSLLGRVNADGQGNFVQDAFGIASPLTRRQITGTYTVNADCSGTATLVGADGARRKINFVIVNPGGPNATQSIVFAFSDAGVVGSGLAQQQ